MGLNASSYEQEYIAKLEAWVHEFLPHQLLNTIFILLTASPIDHCQVTTDKNAELKVF